MTVRGTSISAFEEMRHNGVLSKRQSQVYKALFDFGEQREDEPTATELFRSMRGTPGAQSNQNIVTRLGELRDIGCVDECQKRPCMHTKATCLTWKVNNKVGIKKKSYTVRKKEQIRRLRKALEMGMPVLKTKSPSTYARMKVILRGDDARI